jgi:hypothetical protein
MVLPHKVVMQASDFLAPERELPNGAMVLSTARAPMVVE